MDSKIIVVIGATGTIGSSCATYLIKKGYKVIGIVRNASKAIAINLPDFFICDLLNTAEVMDLPKTLVGHCKKIDGIVNAAGVPGNRFNKIDIKQWQNSFQINVIAPIVLSYLILPFMKRENSSIVNIASVAAFIAHENPDYSSSKSALVAATKSLAWEAANYNVRANCICPGPTESPMISDWSQNERNDRIKRTALKKIATPFDIAKVVEFLLSSQASHITGESISVSGGFEMR
jgi:3-oxoacyl-[acyl-carrier protein] reductase